MYADTAADWRVRARLFFSELVGTALLVSGGLSVVIFMFGEGSPMARLVPNETLRTMLSPSYTTLRTTAGGSSTAWPARPDPRGS
jgi:hypothetical protein